MKLLLDTNAYSALLRGHPEVVTRVRRAEHVVLSTIVAGELLFGFRAGMRPRKNLAELESSLDSPYVTLAPVTYTTADRFGRIAAALRAKGRPIPANDVWIAAHAMETGAELLSFDRHFDAVDGLAWVSLDAGQGPAARDTPLRPSRCPRSAGRASSARTSRPAAGPRPSGPGASPRRACTRRWASRPSCSR